MNKMARCIRILKTKSIKTMEAGNLLKTLLIIIVMFFNVHNVFGQNCPSKCGSECGNVLLNFHNTAVKSNGTCSGSWSGNWQCLELAERYYDHYEWFGNPNVWFETNEIEERQLEPYYNNISSFAPVPGNAIIFEDPDHVLQKAGHIGIVKSVNIGTQTSTITIVHQNWHVDSDGEATIALSINGSGENRTYSVAPLGSTVSYITTGWQGAKIGQKHDGSINSTIVTAYNRHGAMLGTPFDNSGGPYLHYWSRTNIEVNNDGVWVQDFMQPDLVRNHHGDDGQTMIVYNKNTGNASLIRDGFLAYYKTHEGYFNLGAPLDDESGGVQYFEKGRLIWFGSAVYAIDTNGDQIGSSNVSWNYTTSMKNNIVNQSSLNDGIYHENKYIASLSEPLPLLEGYVYSDFYAIILGGRVEIDPFTINGNTTLYIGHTETVGDSRVIDISTSSGSTLLAGELFDVSAEILNHTDDGEMYDFFRIRLLDAEYKFVKDFYRPANPTWIAPHTTIDVGANNLTIDKPGIYYITVQYSEFGPGWYDFYYSFVTNPTMIEVLSPDMNAFSVDSWTINPSSGNTGDVFSIVASLVPTNDFSYVDELKLEVKDSNGSIVSQNSRYGINVASYSLYSISLQATPSIGGIHTISVSGSVNGNWQEYGVQYFNVDNNVTAPIANYSVDVNSGVAPLTVQFTDLSSGSTTEWFWQFGDNETSNDQHPSHIYNAAGSYTVSLRATNSAGDNTVVGGDPIVVTDNSNGDIQFDNWLISLNPGAIGQALFVYGEIYNTGNSPIIFSEFSLELIDPNGQEAYEHSSNNITINSNDFYQHYFNFFPEISGYHTVRFRGELNGQWYTYAEEIVYVAEVALAADFSVTPLSGDAPLDVQFTDLSVGTPISWEWNLGDGNYAYVQNPTHTYNQPGVYGIRLVITSEHDETSKIKSNHITVTGTAPLIADFTTTPDYGALPLSVQFTDQTTGSPDTWAWSFGDGAISTEQNPNYTYNVAGNYTVTLTASNSTASDTEVKTSQIIVFDPVIAYFSFSFGPGAEPDFAPATVNFLDESWHGVPSIEEWLWEFGDGTFSSEQFPTHLYNQPGDYDVTLSITDDISESSYTTDIHIKAYVEPEFIADITSGPAPLIVQFTDQSSGGPTSWAWDFGDGGGECCATQNPVHTYTTPGVYSVRMDGDNDDESDYIIKTDYITVTESNGCIGDGAYHFNGVDQYLSFSPYNPGTSDITIEGWINLESFNSPSCIFFQEQSGPTGRPNIKVVVETNGVISFTASRPGGGGNSQNLLSNTVVQLDEWTNFVCSRENGVYKIYINGILDSEVDLGNNFDVTGITSTGFIGRRFNSNYQETQYYTQGSVDEIRVSNFARSASEISNNFVKGNELVSDGNTILLWHLNGTSGTSEKLDNADGNNMYDLTEHNSPIAISGYNECLPLEAEFVALQTSGYAPLTVQFTDSSKGNPTSWLWDFGDGGTSIEQHTSYVYTLSGIYSVSLIINDGIVADTITKVEFITILENNPVIKYVFVESDTLNWHVLSNTPVLEWSLDSLEGSVQTDIEIAIGTDNDWAFAEMWNPAPITSADTFITYNGSSLIDGETYYGRLKVSNGTVWTDWFEFSFRMNSKPSTPVALTPIDFVVTNSMPILWVDNSVDAEGDALFYDFSGNKYTGAGLVFEPLLVGDDIVEGTDSTGLSVSAPLEENRLHLWEVRAFDGYEYSGWTTLLTSAFWVNDVNEPPTAPVALNPDETTSPLYNMQPTFSWTESDDPDPFFDIYYKLHLAIDSDFAFVTVIDSIYSFDSTGSPDFMTYTLTFPLEHNEQYWWKVEATDSFGVSSMSNTQHFWTSCCIGLRGNVDGDAGDAVDISDLVFLVDFFFTNGEAPTCADEANVDGNAGGDIDISDLVYLVDFIFTGGPAPAVCP